MLTPPFSIVCWRIHYTTVEVAGQETEVSKIQITEKNCRIADEIMEILAEEKCTVEESQEILSSVSAQIRKSSTVQIKETFTKKFMNVL